MEFNSLKILEFICDSMFGKLAKWLRMAGYFTEYIKNTEREKFLKNFFIPENKIFVTRDIKLLKKSMNIFYLDEEDVFLQFKIIKEKFNLNFNSSFTICMECNLPLKVIKKEENKNKIPEYVYMNFNEFNICEKCKRIYWKGSHYMEMKKKIKKIFDLNDELY